MSQVYRAVAVNFGICAALIILWVEFFVESLEYGFSGPLVPFETAHLVPLPTIIGFFAFLWAYKNIYDSGILNLLANFIWKSKFGRTYLVASSIWAILWTVFTAMYFGRHSEICMFNCGYKWHLDDWIRWLSGVELPHIVLLTLFALEPVLRKIASWISEGT